LELQTLYYDPGYCLSSGGSPAVLAMTIRSNTDLWRRAETHLATITATSNFILFHAGHRKLGMSNRNRDNLLVKEPRKRVQEIIADISSGGVVRLPSNNNCTELFGIQEVESSSLSERELRRVHKGKV
jgi:hypothetical protein